MTKKTGVTFRYLKKAEPYLDALAEVGIECVCITPDNPRSLEGLGALVVTGGTDVNPRLYGQEPHPETDSPSDEERDAMESRMIKEALDADLAVIAICRGMQLFNVIHGGALNQHIPQVKLHGIKPPPEQRHLIVHTVHVEPGAKLASILGTGEHPVNSRHHQAVEVLGEGLIVSARAPDRVIEAIEHPGKRFAVAFQWHPEDCIRTNPGDRRIFEAFAAAL